MILTWFSSAIRLRNLGMSGARVSSKLSEVSMKA